MIVESSSVGCSLTAKAIHVPRHIVDTDDTLVGFAIPL